MVMCMFVIVSALTYLENHTDKRHTLFLANVNSLIAVARPPVCLSSVVYNARAPYSDSCKFRQFYYGIWYLWPSVDMHRKSYADRPRKPPPSGVKPKRGRKYSDFRPIEGYILETVPDRR